MYTCPYVPAEWIAAHGLRPRRLIPLPTESQSVALRLEGLCPYARAFVNDAAAENADGIVVTTLCDQMRRVYDLLVRDSGKPAFLLNVPKTWQTVAAQRLYVDELKRLGRFLIRLGGRTPSNEDLAKTMVEYVGCAVHTISPMPRKDGVPIAVVGGPLMQRDRVLFNLIEDSGGRVVLDATETGLRGQRRPFDRRRLVEDPLLELADAYFSIPDASRRPNSGLYKWLKNELVKTNARGIVFHHYLWCDAWRAELSRLREWASLPVLGLDGDAYDETNLARSQNRIRAFLEMLH
ncbi:MAG: 2-hydroxyacyl-CoA dehydratase [Phycisphaerae bacterium]|nr:2-hydroxyacyl-CoA dehydratase [Phycisphaerae bacterium]